VLHGLSIQLQYGEIVGLLGPNGAGKSTTIKLIAGLQTARTGSVRVLGHCLPDDAVAVKQRLGYVPETPALFESLTGQEFLELCGRLHSLPEERLQPRIAGLLEAFGLTTERVARLDTYSKGMRQKILLAAALLHDPDLLLLDEPLSGLDVHSALLIKDLLSALAAEGKAILYSSHVLDVVERVCSRVLIIDHGSLVAAGDVQGLQAQTGQERLEDVFRQLTGVRDLAASVRLVVESMRR
jgi:ABC-2 type transport system ATP-binding protein